MNPWVMVNGEKYFNLLRHGFVAVLIFVQVIYIFRKCELMISKWIIVL